MSQGERMRRVNEGVREVISSALAGSARDKLAGFVTITDVHTSPDLHHATVYVSVFGSADETASTFDALEELRIGLQREIADHLRMKYTPILQFENDDSVDRATRVNELINEEAEFFDERSS
ncbi:MAG: 30S ribosome-binding factor RbfA [Thermoleophilaceae bacterium]|nr:30S ribosome-binding factor RbfA [Thermoleophilaceae bacterium]